MITDINGRPLSGQNPLDDVSIQACGEEVQAALVKYNCSIEFIQLYRNGLPMDTGRLKIVKNQPIKQDHPAH